MRNLLHLHCQELVIQPGPGGRQAGHGSGQPDVAAQAADLYHQFIALLEKPDFAFGGKRQMQAHLVSAVLLDKAVRLFDARQGSRVFAVRIEDRRQFLEPLRPQHLLR